MKKPYISGDWRVLFRPTKNGNYVNDHTIVIGSDKKWHLFGITSFEGIPSCERYFVHGVGESLDGELAEVGRSIDRGTLAWAPCVINKGENYYMFYGPSPTSLAVSFDMYEWFGTSVTLNNEPLMGAHRDHFVLKLSENEYLMYVVGVYDKKGAISCFSSSDLLSWNFEGFALTSGNEAPLTPAWGAFESPYVVKKDGRFTFSPPTPTAAAKTITTPWYSFPTIRGASVSITAVSAERYRSPSSARTPPKF